MKQDRQSGVPQHIPFPGLLKKAASFSMSRAQTAMRPHHRPLHQMLLDLSYRDDCRDDGGKIVKHTADRRGIRGCQNANGLLGWRWLR